MPNAANILAPACLIGSGRSGTTLVTALLRRHHQVQALGETANVVFSTLFHIERTLPLCGPTYDKANAPAAAAAQIHRMLVDLFPSDRPRWFQKPIMMPAARRMFPSDAEFNDWYWAAAVRLFPEARWFTVVRNWRDVARSAMQRWGWTAEVAIRSQIRISEMLLHRESRLGLVVDFAGLVAQPEAEARRLLAYLDLPWDAACLEAFAQPHAPNRYQADPDTIVDMQQRGFAHEEEAGESLASSTLDALQAELLAQVR